MVYDYLNEVIVEKLDKYRSYIQKTFQRICYTNPPMEKLK